MGRKSETLSAVLTLNVYDNPVEAFQIGIYIEKVHTQFEEIISPSPKKSGDFYKKEWIQMILDDSLQSFDLKRMVEFFKLGFLDTENIYFRRNKKNL